MKSKKLRSIAIAAMSIDGKIARSRSEGTHWTSKEDKTFLHKILDGCDLIVVGNTTYQLAKEPLSKRNCIVLTRSVEGITQVNTHLTYCNPEEADIQKLIEQKGYARICLLGGQKTYDFFFERGLIDELFITIEPIIFGKGISLLNKPLDKANQSYHLVSVKRLNEEGTLLLHYERKRKDH